MKQTTVGRRLDDLAAAYALAPGAASVFEVILQRLQAPEAPTAVRDAQQAVDLHIADSLTGLRTAPLRSPTVVADLGSGAGLPGLVLAVARPAATVYAIESTGRKCAFIAATAQQADLSNVHAVQRRAEEWSDGRGLCDVVCARALAALPVLLEYAAPLLRIGGSLVAWKGAVDHSEVAAATAAAEVLGFGGSTVVPVVPFARAERRTLHVYTKHAETPERYPRRAGMAVKRPLGVTPS